MAERIDDEMLDYVGILAKLDLTGAERERARADMEEMLSYIDLLNELDTDGTEPMSHVLPVNNVFREDAECDGHYKEKLLRCAPEAKDGCFVVPRTVE